MERTFSLPCS